MLLVSISLILILITSIWIYKRKCHSYWTTQGVGGPSPTSIMGHMSDMMTGEPWNFVLKNYEKFKSERVFGIYNMLSPSLFVCDPELLKYILVKDFDHFTDRRTFAFVDHDEYLRKLLFIMGGDDWRKMRNFITPAFSSAKMKKMYETIDRLGDEFIMECSTKESKFDSKDMFGKFALQVIGTCAFGINPNTYQDNCKFVEASESLFSQTFVKTIKTMLYMTVPNFAKAIGVNLIDEDFMFLLNVSKQTLAQRRESGENRGDFLDLLIEVSKNEEHSEFIDDAAIISQSILFLMTGYDTTANALAVSSYYLAKHQDYQKELRDQLKEMVDDNGKIDYYKLLENKFADAILSETLRLNPPLSFLERTCVKDYILPELNINIPKDMVVNIPVWGLHRDPNFWENPEEFNPNRFMGVNNERQPFTYMPFGLGPRNCVAMRFAIMEAKVCLAKLILKYSLKHSPGHEELTIECGDGNVRPVKNSICLVLDKLEQD